jgi:hypothetical protein
MGMQWFHPDEYSIIARCETSGLYVGIQATGGVSELDVGFVLQFFGGERDDFQGFCKGVEEEVAGNIIG